MIEFLYHKYHTYMSAIAFRVVRDEGNVQDILHDTVIVLWEQYSNIRLDNEFALRAYIGRITQRIAINYRRKNSKEQELYIFRKEQAVDDYSEWHGAESAEYYLSLIDEKSAELVRLKILDGYSYREIAQMMGVAEPTVRKRMERALEKLRKAVHEEDER